MFPASVPLGVCLVGGGGKVLGKFWLNKEVSILKGSACLSQDFRESRMLLAAHARPASRSVVAHVTSSSHSGEERGSTGDSRRPRGQCQVTLTFLAGPHTLAARRLSSWARSSGGSCLAYLSHDSGWRVSLMTLSLICLASFSISGFLDLTLSAAAQASCGGRCLIQPGSSRQDVWPALRFWDHT